MSNDLSANSAQQISDFFSASLSQRDPAIQAAIDSELGRQQHEIELIASENIVSAAVMEAPGLSHDQQVRGGLPR